MKIVLAGRQTPAVLGLAASLRAADHECVLAESAARLATGAQDLTDVDAVLVCVDDAGPEVGLLEGVEAVLPEASRVVIAKRAGLEDIVHALDVGADDYLVSPVVFAEVVARLRAIGRRTGAGSEHLLQVGALRLDVGSRRVWRSGDEIQLSAKEFAVLEVFMRHPGTVLSRTALLSQAWDVAHDSRSNVVDQCIAQLRSKIDTPFGQNDLQTVRGAGYRLAG